MEYLDVLNEQGNLTGIKNLENKYIWMEIGIELYMFG
mgnify:CR=1 FL=1